MMTYHPQAVIVAGPSPSPKLAGLFIDLDVFQKANDSLENIAGDMDLNTWLPVRAPLV